MVLNVPVILTLLRIVLLPVIVIVFYLDHQWARPASCIIFLLAGLTDWADGYLARRLGQESRFGAFLDPVADKLMVATVLLLIVGYDHSLWLTIPAIIVIGREITISALREWMAEMGQRGKVAVSYLGKVKTTMQIVALALLLWHHDILGLPTYKIGLAALYVATILTIWSMVSYIQAAFASDHLPPKNQ